MILNETECCGLREIDGLASHSAEVSLIMVAYDFFDDMEGVFILFTGVVRERYGQEFKKLILKNKLGKVIETSSRLNPNSRNKIKVWVWEVRKGCFKKWYYNNIDKICINWMGCMCDKCRLEE